MRESVDLTQVKQKDKSQEEQVHQKEQTVAQVEQRTDKKQRKQVLVDFLYTVLSFQSSLAVNLYLCISYGLCTYVLCVSVCLVCQ